MYDSRPRPTEGERIEEVLPAAINATATSAKGESQKASRTGGELAHRHSADDPGMAVMRAGSVTLRVPALSAPLLLGAAAVLVLVVLAVVIF